MKITEIKTALAAIYGTQILGSVGVSRTDMAEAFNDSYPDAKQQVGSDLFDDLLRRLCGDIISANDRHGVTQEQFDGMELPATVTVPDELGDGYRRKLLKHATLADIDADWEIQQQNLSSATRSFRLSDQLRKRIAPVMRAHNLATVGDALEWMTAHGNEVAS